MKIYGEVVSVKDGRVLLLLPNGFNQSLAINETIADELRSRVGRFVGVWAIKHEEITAMELLPYRGDDANPLAAIERIEEAFPGRWDGVNVVEYVREQREE